MPPIAAISGPIGICVSASRVIAPRSSRACRARSQSSRFLPRPNARRACRSRAPAPPAPPCDAVDGAASRSISLPFTCTTSWISSRASSAGSASGHGSSHTRRPVIISYTSAPRCGANGKISDPAVATANRTSPGGADLALPVDLVRQLHHGGDGGVEAEVGLHVPGDLVDRPVRLAEQVARLAVKRGRTVPFHRPPPPPSTGATGSGAPRPRPSPASRRRRTAGR